MRVGDETRVPSLDGVAEERQEFLRRVEDRLRIGPVRADREADPLVRHEDAHPVLVEITVRIDPPGVRRFRAGIGRPVPSIGSAKRTR